MKTLTALGIVGKMFVVHVYTAIIGKTAYPITLSSDPEKATYVVIDKKGREVTRGLTPDTIILKARSVFFKKQTYELKFLKLGHEEKTLSLYPDKQGFSFGNFTIGGVHGFLYYSPESGAQHLVGKNGIRIELKQKVIAPLKKEDN